MAWDTIRKKTKKTLFHGGVWVRKVIKEKVSFFTCVLSTLLILSSCNVGELFRFYTHIQLLWKTEDTNGMITNNVLVTEDTVYAGIAGWEGWTESGLLAIDRKTGKFKWKVPVESLTHPYPSLPTPVYYDDGKDGIVLFGAGCHFFAVNAKTGEIIWHFNGLSEENRKKYGFKDEPWQWDYFEMTPVIYKDMVIAYASHVTFAFDIKTGEIIWSTEGCFGYTSRGDMLIKDGVVYEMGNYWATALKAETGEVIWDRNIIFGGGESSPCMGDGKLYMGESATVGALDMKTGDIVWQVDISQYNSIMAGCLYYKGKVYIGCEKLWALDAKTGELIWEAPIDGVEAAPVEYNGKIYVLDDGCTLWCVDPDTGKIEWSENIERTVVFGDITIKDGIFYAGGGWVYAFKVKE